MSNQMYDNQIFSKLELLVQFGFLLLKENLELNYIRIANEFLECFLGKKKVVFPFLSFHYSPSLTILLYSSLLPLFLSFLSSLLPTLPSFHPSFLPFFLPFCLPLFPSFLSIFQSFLPTIPYHFLPSFLSLHSLSFSLYFHRIYLWNNLMIIVPLFF